MFRRMVQKVKENGTPVGEWLYRGLAIYFLWNIYIDVKEIPVHSSQIKTLQDKDAKQDDKLQKLEDVIFVPSWERHIRKEAHLRETNKNIAETTELLAESDSVNSEADLFLSNTN